MPSDPSGHKPVGVLTRPAQDWFDDYVGIGAAEFVSHGGGPLPNNFVSVALFNNASSGVALKVYQIVAWNESNSNAELYFVVGTIGTFQRNCSPLRPDNPIPYGQIYMQIDTVVNNFDPPPYNFGDLKAIILGGTTSGSTYYGAPLVTVPPGYSLVVTTPNVALNGGASFWYQQSNE